MSQIIRFGVAMNKVLLDKFDNLILRKGYRNRSEAFRDLTRNAIVEEEWTRADNFTVGSLTIVYNHHTRELADTLTALQHQSHNEIISSMHVHLDEHNCLEVLVIKGRVSRIKKIADRLISTKGVKHGKLVMTTTGKGVS